MRTSARKARRSTQFLEYEPTEGAETRFKTEVCVAYDDKYFYVLARMFDPAPDSIISLLSRRDVRTQSEQLKLVIDSYNDKRTAYQFAVNPAGVKRDFYVYNDDTEDPSWDAVWDVATAIDSLGWVAEFRIPFSQLRFASKPSHTFGLMIVRDVARTNARISWPLYYRSKQGYVSQSGEINGIASIPIAAAARGRSLRRREERDERGGGRGGAEDVQPSDDRLLRRGHQVRAVLECDARRDPQPGLRSGRGRSGDTQPHGVRDLP